MFSVGATLEGDQVVKFRSPVAPFTCNCNWGHDGVRVASTGDMLLPAATVQPQTLYTMRA